MIRIRTISVTDYDMIGVAVQTINWDQLAMMIPMQPEPIPVSVE
jgi:hypothetical protein